MENAQFENESGESLCVFSSHKPLRWSALEVSSLKHSSLGMRRFGGVMFRGCRGAPHLSWFGGGDGGSGPREAE